MGFTRRVVALGGIGVLAFACASSRDSFEADQAPAQPAPSSAPAPPGDTLLPGAATCSDGAKNGSETDVDCGGSCAACGEGKKCAADGDCATKKCAGGTCCSSHEYDKTSGPISSQGQVCCDKGDELVSYGDCGSGNHVVMPAGNCAFGAVGGGGGTACAKITCRASTCSKSCQGDGYTRSTGPAGGQVCCDTGDTLVKILDCGNGNNHSVSTSGRCGVAVEGSGNYGSACAQIFCATTPCPGVDAGPPPPPK